MNDLPTAGTMHNSCCRFLCRIMLPLFLGISIYWSNTAAAQKNPLLVTVGKGWAGNSVNTVIFRKNALTSNGNLQYIAWYDKDGYIVLGKRVLPHGPWKLKTTGFRGDITDAHRSISIMADGNGYLHMAWDHHNTPLNYCRSIAPGSLEMTGRVPMTGMLEDRVTYPEFHRLPNGNLIFLYRDGQSGRGNLVINAYDLHRRQWKQLHHNLIDGQDQRSAYWQACTDKKGNIHLSWVWRETADVASNHDLCYAKSPDGGITWTTAAGKIYTLPVNAATAEYICRIPQNSTLINQTSACADDRGHPFIASYWRSREDSVPQYHLVFNVHGKWTVYDLGFRKTPFSLGGMGTKRIPISRPQVISWQTKGHTSAAVIFRDEERKSKVSVALNPDIEDNRWQVKDLTTTSAGSWEPSYDTEWWKQKKALHLFVQFTDQKDAEGRADIPSQDIQVLEWQPGTKARGR